MIHELTVFIAAESGMADRLLRAHVADRLGRCRGCPNGRAGHMPWPCSLHAAAIDALARQARATGMQP
ncbi:hypothetical protein [Pseudonocardia xinjiangensis]|uniref:Uncharacterized protein n=1 Tax=Pseudonocardia xinjiangensis TaxID=75289 RepID=A0ABX1RG03_9PSEU|nr:hypothetical protein [Pseudonocardia xinjiangensis]NMH79322.1 hypothetical protein [Pseudonocardia xinjiangensis]